MDGRRKEAGEETEALSRNDSGPRPQSQEGPAVGFESGQPDS